MSSRMIRWQKEVVRYMNDNGLETISWNFTLISKPDLQGDNFGASLLEYARGSKEWKAVVSDMKRTGLRKSQFIGR